MPITFCSHRKNDTALLNLQKVEGEAQCEWKKEKVTIERVEYRNTKSASCGLFPGGLWLTNFSYNFHVHWPHFPRVRHDRSRIELFNSIPPGNERKKKKKREREREGRERNSRGYGWNEETFLAAGRGKVSRSSYDGLPVLLNWSLMTGVLGPCPILVEAVTQAS